MSLAWPGLHRLSDIFILPLATQVAPSWHTLFLSGIHDDIYSVLTGKYNQCNGKIRKNSPQGKSSKPN